MLQWRCRIGYIGLLLFLFLMGCSQKSAPEEKKELLIYCGITMIQPMTELAKIIEKEEGCKVIITKGGSGNLLKSIRASKVGDLYLPGSDSYIRTCEKEGLVSESVYVGTNKAVMMVAKGNPKNIPADLMALTSPKYYVVIGNPNSGSIGRETKKILVRRGIFEQVLDNVKELTTDSKDLVKVFKTSTADLVINWYATSTWAGNSSYVDVLPIDSKYAQEKRLVLGLLASSGQPEIAKKFMALATSDVGRALFEKFGLYSQPS